MNLEDNKRLVAEYPFLAVYDISNKSEIDYCFTMLDDMPPGWKKAFGEEICKEIKDVLIKHDCLNEYSVIQIKEKFGMLRWYGNRTSRDIEQIISKYEEKSGYTCICCGAPATQMILNWISPICDECLNNTISKPSTMPIDEYWSELNEE